MADFDYKKLCTPAKIYFALAVFSAIMMLIRRASMMAVLIKLVGSFIWTVILGWLCKKGLTIVSWGLVLLPFVMMFFAEPHIEALTRGGTKSATHPKKG